MTASDPHKSLHGFNVMLQAEDARGVCFLAYGCAAHDAEEAARLVRGAAQAEGFWAVEVDEVWRPDGANEENLGTVPEVFGRLEPTYVDDEELGPEAGLELPDDED